MAKKRKKKAEPSELPSHVGVAPSLGIEALGLVTLLLATGLCLVLFVFDPQDPGHGRRLIGPLGVSLAEMMLSGIGALGYAVGILAVFGGGAVLLGRARWPRPIQIVAALGICVSATLLAHLVWGDNFVLGYPAGGMIGAVLAELLSDLIGTVGAGLLAAGFISLGLVGLLELSFGTALRDAGRLASWLGLETFGRLAIWKEAREVERAHEEELLLEHEEKQQEKARKAAEKETALREKLEEKKRLAVLKAKAKAEEKVLAKIAAKEAKEQLERELEEKARLEAEEAAAREAEEAAAREAVDAPWEVGELIDVPTDVNLDAPGPGPEDDSDEDALDEEEYEEEYEEEEPEVIVARGGSELPEEEEELEEGDEEEEYEEDAYEEDAYDEEEGYEDEEEEDDSGEDEEEAVSPLSRAFSRRKSAQGVDDPESFLGPQIFEERPEGASEELLNDRAEPEAGAAEEAPLEYELPPLRLLDYEGAAPEPIDQDKLKASATRLEEKLRTYGVDGRVTAIRPGPVVTTYEYQPAPGVKVAKIANLTDDIAMSMAAKSVRIIAPIPGKGVVGIELPNETRETVYLKEIIAHDRFQKSKSLLTLALGKDTEGDSQCRNLAKMPHLLVAGTTGSGKSVSVNAMILSILYKATPEQVKFIMVDPKMLELSLYNDIPHLLLPVVTDATKASRALQWAVDEMERRYKMLSDFKVRNIEGFNKKLKKLRDQRDVADLDFLHEDETIKDPRDGEELPKDLPYIVVLIDEFADLMCVAPRDVEASVQRLAQKARAAGIHVLLATQRPSTDVITGVIKNNFPSRMSFRVSSRHDSSTIINSPGAENLLGMGDMLSLGNDGPNPIRIHGAYVSEDEVQRVAEFWKAQAKPAYDETILKPREDEGGGDDFDEEKDENYDRAVAFVTETRKASISSVQRKLRVGYNRAARMIEMMEREGVVSSPTGPKGEREVLVGTMAADGPPRS